MKILLAEDEEQLSRVLVAAMQSVNYDVDAVFNGRDAVELARKNSYDVIILDIMMPIMDGITALKQIRKSGDKTYVLMLTAKAEIDDRVTGLDSGADDYLTKPFSLKELLARLRSKERRDDKYTPNEVEVGDLALNVAEQELVSHNSIRLGSKETQLLNYLMLNEGKEFSTSDLLAHVWKDDEDANEDIVWIYISYLRQKLQSIQSTAQIVGEKGGSFSLIR
ncbi:DNA-binding response regulator [Lactobacillus taiwanensis]|uniref:response regulator transcription factor n=1 Tax=Lactobacillus taiwanensis TaxID=508451 RepID=UPI000B993EAB|nr:response regulator transcription factor [Lactobacillus taiwanensis]OYR99160.1 DNA-binding response regulator [Lactobacillus taiwanensis]OYS05493.1 DNA-binding response regulator [Lactobacillus taiwanensis]